MKEEFQISTDTATIAVFDIQSLKHRIDDDADWWSVPSFELAEVNLGNALIAALGQDGVYLIQTTDMPCLKGAGVNAILKCPSGKVYIGAGEDITGAGIDPENARHLSGRFIHLDPGIYRVKMLREITTISVYFECASSTETNTFSHPLDLL